MTFRRPATFVACLVALIVASAQADEAAIPSAPERDDPPRVFVSGVPDDFAETRAAIAAAKQSSGRDYRVVVVDATDAGDAAGLLERVIARWREDSARSQGGFNPAGDVTIVLDVGDRQIAMDVPWALEASAGLNRGTLERELISTIFVPRAKDGLYDAGLAELVAATERWVDDRAADRRRKEEASRVFATRTLPLGLLGLGTAGLLGGLAVQWTRHGRRVRAAREKLAAFKADVVGLSDLLDAQQERHRMLPHSDPDFVTPMQGMTRSTYDAVQASIRRYRERWLSLMDVWEKAQASIDREWFLGTRAADEAITLLDSAEARPPLADVAAECRAPLDALETAHERARESASALDAAIAEADGRLKGIATRGRSSAPFQATLTDVSRARVRAGEGVERGPVAARGGLEDARATLDAVVTRLDAFEAADDRRQAAVGRIAEVRRLVAQRRADGWRLDEPGANPNDRLDGAARQADLAAQLLDSGEIDVANGHLDVAERSVGEAAALLENIVAARAKARDLLPACAARVEQLVVRRQEALAATQRLAESYADASWSDVADNVARADDGLQRVRTLLDEAQAAIAPGLQHDLRGAALLEETVRQLDWVEACLAAVIDRLAELDELRAALPGRHDAATRRVAALEQRLGRQRTDRVRANERCREAARILGVADGVLRGPRPDPTQSSRLIEAADATAARGEELADEDERLARQADSDIDETDALVRRIAAWYAEGVQADVRSAASAVDTARSLLERQRYEDAIRTAAEASQQARLAYATATAEADRRRLQRQQEIQRRQLEESFTRMSRGVGPWVVRLPGGAVTGPDPWRSMTAQPKRSPPASGGWSRDIAQVGW